MLHLVGWFMKDGNGRFDQMSTSSYSLMEKLFHSQHHLETMHILILKIV